jgi:amidophosphoribosyltransferase
MVFKINIDSIVRGTTSREIVAMARQAGAKKVYFASCAPEIRFPNVYGIDMPSRKELVAYNRTCEQIAKEIGADQVIYQNLDDMVNAISSLNTNITTFDVSVFTGKYVTGDIDLNYIENLERQRSDSVQNLKQPISEDVMGLHNFQRK